MRAAKSLKNSHTSPKQIELQKKRAQALELRERGCGYQQISDAMNISLSSAFEYVTHAMMQITAEKAETVRDLELRRLDAMQASIYPQAIAGDLQAQAGMDRIMNRRARLLGLDAPTKTAITDPEGKESQISGIMVSFVKPAERD